MWISWKYIKTALNILHHSAVFIGILLLFVLFIKSDVWTSHKYYCIRNAVELLHYNSITKRFEKEKRNINLETVQAVGILFLYFIN